MKLLKFVKIDFIRLKTNRSLLVLWPLSILIIMLFSGKANTLFVYLYCLFGGIIFSTIPLDSHSSSGFLKMLPSKEGDDVRGHFLFSFCLLLLSMLFALAATQAVTLYRPEFSALPAKQVLLLFSLSVLITALQNLILCTFRSNNVQAMQMLRMGPAFLFYFGTLVVADHLPKIQHFFAGWFQLRNVCLLLLICFLFYCIIAQFSAVLISRRDD
ncbi:MAG: ABC-2 transporter permease [Lachnospiraceae bacterium]|nr:ABC-2 transporter permease [Lachnospiraceae bacterium]